jgi:hypothetical protein
MVGLGVDLLIALLLFVTRIRCRIRAFIDAYMLSDGPFEQNFVGMRNRPGVMVIVGGPGKHGHRTHFSNSRFCKMSIISQHEIRNCFGESMNSLLYSSGHRLHSFHILKLAVHPPSESGQ